MRFPAPINTDNTSVCGIYFAARGELETCYKSSRELSQPANQARLFMTASGGATDRVSLGAMISWILALLTTLCVLSVPSRARTIDLVTAPVDPAVRVVLRDHRAPWALPQNIQGPVPSNTVLEHLTLVLKRSPQQQRVFEQFLQELQDPASRNYHHFLTPIQVGKRFGASQLD